VPEVEYTLKAKPQVGEIEKLKGQQRGAH